MKISLLKTLSLCMLAGAATFGTALGAGLDQNLVAKWTFKNGSLKSDVGDYTFTEGGRGTLETRDGSITLGDRKYLVAAGISSASLPKLEQSVTLWARMRFDEFPESREMTVLSLQNVPANGGWREVVFGLIYRGPQEGLERTGFAFLARAKEDKQLGVGVSRFEPVAQGQFVDVAIVFDGHQQTGTMYIDGKIASTRIRDAKELNNFAALAIGLLTAHGRPGKVTFEEVRVYSVAISADWLAEIRD